MSSSAKQLTYKEAMDAHARDYLTRVLKATGGERQRAAEMAGLNRTHLQALIKRFGISIDFDPKARGRRKNPPITDDPNYVRPPSEPSAKSVEADQKRHEREIAKRGGVGSFEEHELADIEVEDETGEAEISNDRIRF